MVVKSSVSQQVIDYIKENIAEGIWLVGEKIPSENELCKILGVSRATVRMAIQQFIALGVLESFHGKGTFVMSKDLSGFGKGVASISVVDMADISQMMEFRRVLEPEACALAASRAKAEDIRQLHSLLENMKKAFAQDDSESFVRYDMMFHEQICHATGNQLLLNALQDIFRKKIDSHKQINQFFGYKDGIYYHTLILQAIEGQNPKKAHKIMYEHMQKAIDDLKTDSG